MTRRSQGKPVRYWIRNEIEEIIKEENINRDNFFEVSKLSYARIINRFYHAFFDNEDINLEYAYLKFQKKLIKSETIKLIGNKWDEYINSIRNLIPLNSLSEIYYIVLSEGWVYEGKINEIIDIMCETDGLLKDFYIVSKKFDWLIVHCDDDECMYSIWHN